MRWQRRGFRRGTDLNPRNNRGIIAELDQFRDIKPPVSWETFYENVKPLLRPNFQGEIPGLSGDYRELTKTQQKNLTDKIAGQILFAHYDIVKDILKRLSNISLDLSQQTEVAYRRLRLVDRFF